MHECVNVTHAQYTKGLKSPENKGSTASIQEAAEAGKF